MRPHRPVEDDRPPGGNGAGVCEPFALTPLGTRITAKQAFARLDVDADGSVTVEEFRRSPGMADEKRAREVVAKVDRVGHLTEKGYQVWADSIRPLLGKLMD